MAACDSSRTPEGDEYLLEKEVDMGGKDPSSVMFRLFHDVDMMSHPSLIATERCLQAQ